MGQTSKKINDSLSRNSIEVTKNRLQFHNMNCDSVNIYAVKINMDSLLNKKSFDTTSIAIQRKKTKRFNVLEYDIIFVFRKNYIVTLQKGEDYSDSLFNGVKPVSSALISKYLSGSIAYNSFYNERDIPSNGTPAGYSQELLINASLKNLGIPFQLTFGANDFPYSSSPNFFNIKLDTAALKYMNAPTLPFNSTSELKDSLIKFSYLEDKKIKIDEQKKKDIFSKYESPNMDFVSSGDSLEYTSKMKLDNEDIKHWRLKDRRRYNNLNKDLIKRKKFNQDRKALIINDSLDTDFSKFKNERKNLFAPIQKEKFSYLKNFKSLEIGRIYPSFSKTTVENISLDGILTSYNVSKSINIKGFIGKPPINGFQKLKQSSGATIEFTGFRKNSITLTYIRNSRPTSFLNIEDVFVKKTNDVLELSDKIKLNKIFSISFSIAMSQDNFSPSDSTFSLVLKDNTAYQSYLHISPSKNSKLKIGYIHTDKNYMALSNPFLWSGNDALVVSASQNLFTNKVKVSGEYELGLRERPNSTESRRIMYKLNAITKFRKLPNLFATVSPMVNTQNLDLTNETINLQQNFISGVFGLFQNLKLKKIFFGYSLTHNVLQSQNSLESGVNSFSNSSLGTNFSWEKFQIQETFTLFKYDKTNGEGLNSIVSYTLKSIKLSILNDFQSTSIINFSRHQLGVGFTIKSIATSFYLKGGFVSFNGDNSAVGSTSLSYYF